MSIGNPITVRDVRHIGYPLGVNEILKRLKRVYAQKRRAEQEIRSLVLEARAAGISQVQIAKAAGVSQPTIAELERTARSKRDPATLPPLDPQ